MRRSRLPARVISDIMVKTICEVMSMIDFKNASYLKLTRVNTMADINVVDSILVPGEDIVAEYKSMRDFIVFTDRRIIAVNVQGFTGKKKDFTSLPYARIQTFSVETAGVFDLDSELELYFSGLGLVRFEFSGVDNIMDIVRLIGEKVL